VAKRPSPKLVVKRIDSIKIPRGFDAIDDEAVAALLEDLNREDGETQSPIHILPDGSLLDGRQRLEANRRAKRPTILCRIWPKGTDRRVFRLRANSLGKTRSAAERSKARAELCIAFEQKRDPGSQKGGRGRVGAATKAAKATGVTKRTVQLDRQARETFSTDERSRLDGAGVTKRARVQLARDVSKLSPSFRARAIEQAIVTAQKRPPKKVTTDNGQLRDCVGHAVPQDRELQTAFRVLLPKYEHVENLLQQAQKTLTSICATASPKRTNRLTRLHDQLRAIGAELRNAKPHSVCPYCKTVEKGCLNCEQSGWVGRQDFEVAEDALKAWGDDAVVVDRTGDEPRFKSVASA